MNILGSLKDKLAEWGLMGSSYVPRSYQRDYKNWLEKKAQDILDGIEPVPPWYFYNLPESYPWEWHGCDMTESYLAKVWLPFWERMPLEEKRAYVDRHKPTGMQAAPPWATSSGDSVSMRHDFRIELARYYWDTLDNKERLAYLKKWQPITEDWFCFWVLSCDTEFDYGKLLKIGKETLRKGEEIAPPWVTFPLSLPSVGWDDCLSNWQLEVWLPFWRGLTKEQQSKYLKRWPLPDDEWKNLITVEWEGKLRKTKGFYEEQKKDLQWHGLLAPPWKMFPFNDAVYEWDEEERDKWIREVWVPYWNNMSENKRNDFNEFWVSGRALDTRWIKHLADCGADYLETLE